MKILRDHWKGEVERQLKQLRDNLSKTNLLGSYFEYKFYIGKKKDKKKYKKYVR